MLPSFQDSIFLFVLALLLFGPKKLPVLARELGKWVGEFRRASNEFKMQMDDELRQAEQADRMKKIEAMEAAAPVTPALAEPAATADGVATPLIAPETSDESATQDGVATQDAEVLPIAEAGELKIMPPATGLPAPRGHALGGLLHAIPAAEPSGAHTAEAVHHGD